ncbi:MAG: STAS domain-containing protein [Chthoniobacterales bacterium]
MAHVCRAVARSASGLRRARRHVHAHGCVRPDDWCRRRSHHGDGPLPPPDVILYRIEGPLFFAATEKLDSALRGSGGKPRVVIFRMRNVPAMDATGLHAFEVAIEKLQRDRVEIFLTAVQPQPMKVMFESGLAERLGLDRFCADIDQALAAVRQTLNRAAD